MIKWAIISFCLIGIALTWILSDLVLQIHDVHGYSTVKEFEALELIDNAKLEALREDPEYKNYSIHQKIKNVGATNHHFETLKLVLSSIFVIIAVLALCLPASNNTQQVSHPYERS